MRNLKSSKKPTRNPNSQLSRLESIHKLINGRAFQPSLVEEKLSQINTSYLTPYCLVYFKYLNVRHHFNYYRAEGALEHLELSMGLLNEMDQTAYKLKVRISNDEYHFTRAYVRFTVSFHSEDEYDTQFIISKVKHITDNALRINPKDSKFKWLKNQLAA
ncbi:hypothetical protein [Psychroserpens sp. SPM9]|uniref:hypothetical protein n=1 Tax=Psychroserpens sp. SPM9 TaxID=2975598 RepID=UPI0021A7C2FF|nr:hypothetical protein [Psychroserpens sp. SPM9]MDG5490610.1 hypothetical protein [Psychroserpens sp. SPM9]